ncbi:class II fructose-bisphosphate aldolase [Enorma sp.]|mgnify:FL=1|uniref:class II fructose-bisphosphate aldolase n=1 Tax=Enorma sp. TaxID=1920692 RepID=UPI0025BD2776|nr:class II fructose-bisphosphate aldolase [Enorma sp.]
MLVTMKAILDHANEHNYGVMAVNSVNMEMVRAVITAAEEERSPIIVQMGVGQMAKLAHMEDIVPLVKVIAERATVPVALNLDHGGKLEDEIRAMQAGFTNVMIDASSLPYEENVARTKTIVALAHGMGISVEAELGHVGQAADGDGRTDDMYTNVEQAVEFVKETGVDALAVAIGTAHGKYPEGFVPKLDFERLAELKAALKMPLVLHGGSGSGEENLKKAVAGGINKINVATDAFAAAKAAVLAKLEEDPKADYLTMEMAAEAGVKQFVKDYIHTIGSNDRYTFEDVDNGSKE